MTNSSKVLFSSMAAEAAHNGAQRYAPRMRKTLQPLPLHTESRAEAVWWRYGSWLTGATLVLCALAMCLPRMQLPAGYHDFADQVAWGVLPYARDVLTNILGSYYGKDRFKIGMQVRIGADEGVIEKIDSISIALRTQDRLILIPTRQLVTERIEILNDGTE